MGWWRQQHAKGDAVAAAVACKGGCSASRCSMQWGVTVCSSWTSLLHVLGFAIALSTLFWQYKETTKRVPSSCTTGSVDVSILCYILILTPVHSTTTTVSQGGELAGTDCTQIGDEKGGSDYRIESKMRDRRCTKAMREGVQLVESADTTEGRHRVHSAEGRKPC